MAIRQRAGWRTSEVFEHTADIGLLARGETLEDVFIAAAEGLTGLLVDPTTLRPRLRRTLAVAGPDREALLVEWLNELLFRFDAEGLAFCRFRIVQQSDTALVARVAGERVAPDRHRLRSHVKAATYHQLAIEPTEQGWRAQVILDV